MPNSLVEGQLIQVAHFSQMGDQQGINVLHYLVTGTTGASVTDQAACTAFSALMGPLYKAFQPQAARFLGTRLQILKPTSFPAVRDVSVAGQGTIVSDPLPTQVAYLLSPRTNRTGRSGRGRTYLPFWPETHSDSTAVPTAGAITLATNWSNSAFATLVVGGGGNTASMAPVIYSRKDGSLQPVLQVVIRVQWATQRRRSQLNHGDTFGP